MTDRRYRLEQPRPLAPIFVLIAAFALMLAPTAAQYASSPAADNAPKPSAAQPSAAQPSAAPVGSAPVATNPVAPSSSDMFQAVPPAGAEVHGPNDGHDHGPNDGHDHGPNDGHNQAPQSIPTVPNRPAFDFSAWETIPVQEGGLEKSMYAFSRDFTKEITGRSHFGGRSPIENYLSMAFEPQSWLGENFLKVSHPELKKIFHDPKHGRISPIELETHRQEWLALLDGPDAKILEKELGSLFHRVDLILGNQGPNASIPSAADRLGLIPQEDFRGVPEKWLTVPELAARTLSPTASEQQVISAWFEAHRAFMTHEPAAFSEASVVLSRGLEDLAVQPTQPLWKFELSAWDSKVGLWRISGWLYLLSAIAFLASWFGARREFSILGGSLLGLGALVHTAALVIRGILANRTPVANLFESAVFIVVCVTIFSLILAIYYRSRILGFGGAILGAFSMGIANVIPLHYGQKIMPLIDALQSYWLNIHVTSMLLSYAFFAIAFFVALSYVIRQLIMSRRPGFNVHDDPVCQYLDSLNFRIITIGVPILTGGVILGAVWAAEAWGRPWAFDPKETAAAITWMIYVFYLHARLFLGWRGPRGIWISILGFAAVIFTYLGVSFFLPGLHSYVSEDGVSFTEFLRKITPGI